MGQLLARAFGRHHKTRLCFVHVPSCGGTTLWQILSDVYGPTNIRRKRGSVNIHDYFEPGDRNARHLRRKTVIGGHMTLRRVREQFPDRKRFTFLRDPVARMRSAHARQIRMGKWQPDPDLGDHDLVRYARSAKRAQLMRRYTTDPLPGAESGVEAIAAQMRDSFDLVCLTSDFDRSLLLMRARYGWPKLPTYDRRNIGQSDRKPLPEDVIAALRDILAGEYEILEAATRVFADHLSEHADAVEDAMLEQFRQANQDRARALLARHGGQSPYDRERRNRF